MLKPIFDITKIGIDYKMCSLPMPDIDAHKYQPSVEFTQEQIDSYTTDFCHPYVVYVPEGWNGHKWWMANTPFPNAKAVFENACIFYADEQENGDAPLLWNGIDANPIVKARNSDSNNCDPILFIENNIGYVFTRDNLYSGHPYYKAQISVDGHTWTQRPDGGASGSEAREVIEDPGKGKWTNVPVGCMGSGSLIKENEKYKLFGWFGREGKTDNPLVNTGRSAGIFCGECDELTNKEYDYTGRVGTIGKDWVNPWHCHVFKDGETYYVLGFCYDTKNHTDGIYLAVSKDGMKNISWYPRPLFVRDSDVSFYKPSALLIGRKLVVYGTIKFNGRPSNIMGGIFADANNYPRGEADIPKDFNGRHSLPFMFSIDFDKLVYMLEQDNMIIG